MAKEKFIMTKEQMEKVVELLNANGYKARESKWNEGVVIESRPSQRHVTLCMDEFNGIYLSTVGQWLDSVEKANEYSRELINATVMMNEIIKITGYGKQLN